jgi:hypothetical protein
LPGLGASLATASYRQHEDVTVATGEPDGARSARARAYLAPRYARPAAVSLLLLIVIVGVGAASPVVTGRGPWHQHAVGIGVGLEAVLAGLGVALLVLDRRSAPTDPPLRALRSALRRVIAVIMVLIVVIAIANIAGNSGSRRGNLVQRLLTHGHSQHPRHTTRAPRTLRSGAAIHISYVAYGLLAAIVLAAVIWCVILLVRVRARPQRPGGYGGEPLPDDPEELREAVDSGRAALRAVDDARAAIIACYVAMEDSLAAAGTSRAVAETPDELLTRAVTAGVIRGQAASRLTGLFYEARFSSHPLEPGAKEAASQALDAIAGELAGAHADAAAGSEP